ncbi:MAG TPA: DmsE family decaheme c-type cytochrome [Steroidobacteraceae bacterium]|nr:DmsE family decaheme c-type cytochrome [Steroidobacteraceae bacterium]
MTKTSPVPRFLLALALLLPAVAMAEVPASAANATSGYSKKGADTCLSCHDEEAVDGIFKTKHGQPGNPRAPFGAGQLQCEACHGPGGNHTKKLKKGEKRPPNIRFGRDSETPVPAQNTMCLNCHRQNIGAMWEAGPHAGNDVPCAGCHTIHKPKDAVRVRATQPDVCYTCHADKRGQFMKPYAHPVREGKLACSDCHTPHGTTADAQLKRPTINETCYECHADKRGPYLWEHAPVTENCANCHNPHGSINPSMLKTRGPLLCQSCHSMQGHQSFSYGPSGLPGGGGPPVTALALGNCTNCHSQVHGSNHPSGSSLTR